MDPIYCQNPFPVYIMGGSAITVGLFYLILSQTKTQRQSPSMYYHGCALFLILGIVLCARTFFVTQTNPLEDIYRDILHNAKLIHKDEKTYLSALISQATHGDASESLSDQVLGWSKALAGFSSSHQVKHKTWLSMRGMSKENATQVLKDRACALIGKVTEELTRQNPPTDQKK